MSSTDDDRRREEMHQAQVALLQAQTERELAQAQLLRAQAFVTHNGEIATGSSS